MRTWWLAALPALRSLEKRPDVFLAVGVAFIVAMLIVGVPHFMLDPLIAMNIAGSLVLLLVALFARSPLQVSTFPSLLLIGTLYRLGLNVSTTRGILARADAGELVDAFGRFVVGGDVVVGLVIFAVVALVQFLVIAKGAERVAEVSARFTLDALPGKQMSIDAALRAGSIDDEEADRRRDDLQRMSQIYGNMDGAMKFVKGDAIAGLVITAINLTGGLIIGVVRLDMTFGEAATVYSTLTIGDALVSQVSALAVTLAAGLLVTRVEGRDKDQNLGFSIRDEILGSAKVLTVGASMMLGLAFVPGFPAVPFVLCAALVASVAARRLLFGDVADPGHQAAESTFEERLERKAELARQQRAVADQLSPSVVPIAVDLDPSLSRALGFDSEVHDDDAELIVSYIPQLRDALYLETGVRIPGVRVRPHVQSLPADTFQIRINDVPVLRDTIPTDLWLATAPPSSLRRLGIEATPIRHPVNGAELSMVPPAKRDLVEAAGIAVWNTGGMIALYLASVLRTRAHDFVGLHEVSDLLDRLEKAYPSLVREVVPKVVSLQQVVEVLRRLVEERVCIRDTKTIVEALGEYGARDGDPVWLNERVRTALGRQIAHHYVGTTNRMSAVLLDPVIEDAIEAGIHHSAQGTMLTLDNEICAEILQSIAAAIEPAFESGTRPVLLTSGKIRRFVRKLVEVDFDQLAVLSVDELPRDLIVQPLSRAELAA